jgi:cytochrome c-type biogenesis protein CcmH
MIWLLFALLTAVAVFSILWPLSRPAPAPEDAADVAFYRAQIAEIDAEFLRGAIDAEQAEAGKAQAARRLLAAAPGEIAADASPWGRRIAALLAIALVPAIALGLYQKIGHPDLPDAPLEARLRQKPAELDIAAAVAKIEAHLAAHPEDGRAWEIVAPVYLRMGRPKEAAAARERALALLGETPERLMRAAEALSYAEDGEIPPEAEKLMQRALAIDPQYMEARYFLGLAAAQHGDKEKARAIWTAMLADLPEDSPVRAPVAGKIAQLDAPPDAAPAPAPSAAAAVAAQAPDAQQKAIHAMVDRLAQRLATQGGGVEEWTRLIRAYLVLKEQDRAEQALADARKALAGDAAAQTQLTATAKELGLKQP